MTALVQAQNGYLWLGTYHGLARFDGARFVVFDSSNEPGLPNGLITSLYEDAAGTLWIGHETGHLTRCVDGRFQPVQLGAGWPGGTIVSIGADEREDLWIVNDSGLLFRPRDGVSQPSPGGVTAPSRRGALARASDGHLLLVANDRVARLEKGVLEPFQLVPGLTNPPCRRVASAANGALWVLAEGRLRKWSDGRWLDEVTGVPTGDDAISVLFETRAGALLVGTIRDGLFVARAGAETRRFCRANRLSHDWVRALCEDHEGNIWIGTGSGLDCLKPRKVRMLNPPDGWRGCAVTSLSVDPRGNAWIGTEGAGLYRLADGQWRVFQPSGGPTNSFVWSVLETRAGQVYAGTWGGGLLRARGDVLERAPEFSGITAPVVALYEDHHGTVWIGTTTGLLRYTAGRVEWVAGKDRLALPDVRAITESADGSLWLGMSGGGLGRLHDGELQQFRKGDGLGSDFIVALLADADGALWIGSSDNGLIRLKNGKFSRIGKAQGLPNLILCHLVDDQQGQIWISAHGGILRARKDDLNACADGFIPQVRFLAYAQAEGLATTACSGGFQPGACLAADGRLWFPTARGLALVDPAEAGTNAVAPPVVIEELLVDGRTVDRPVTPSVAEWAKGLEIPPGRQRFEVRYTGLSFVAPNKVRFRHRLRGLEAGWIEAGAARSVQYSYLRPGAYTFEVTACNNDGVWSATPASLAFTVRPLVWQTWWFQTGSFLAGAGVVGALLVGISRSRVRRRLESLERQRLLERERTRIARDIHDDLGASLTRITMLSQGVRAGVEPGSPAAADLDRIYGTARELTRAMDEIVWAVNPQHDTLDSLVTYLGRFAQQFLSAAGIRCRLDVPMNLPVWALSSETRHHVFLAFKEALNNIVKHAQATEARLSLEVAPEGILLTLADNGRGFAPHSGESISSPDTSRVAGGNGLANMRRRMEAIGGACAWDTAPGEGTRVRLELPRHRH